MYTEVSNILSISEYRPKWVKPGFIIPEQGLRIVNENFFSVYINLYQGADQIPTPRAKMGLRPEFLSEHHQNWPVVRF